MFLGSGHSVTGEFRRSQIVTPVAAECIARMGVTTPCKFEGRVPGDSTWRAAKHQRITVMNYSCGLLASELDHGLDRGLDYVYVEIRRIILLEDRVNEKLVEGTQ